MTTTARHQFIATLLAIILLGSCSLGGARSATIAFVDGESVPSGSRAITLSPDESLSALTSFYDPDVSSIGSLVESYTPTTFRLFIQEIVLYNDRDAIELDVPLSPSSAYDQTPHYADFVEDIVLSPSNPVLPGTYTGMFFFFFASPSVMSVGSNGSVDYVVPQESIVEVTIPGYGGAAWQDQAWTDDSISADIVRHVGDDLFRFSPEYLQPTTWPSVVASYAPQGSEIQRIEQFIYRTDTEYRAILPGYPGHPEIWDTRDADTANLPNYGSTGNASAILMPFDGLDVPVFGEGSIRFTVAWDLDGIVEVYDAGTPDEKSDDIVVLARDFWERFTLTAEVVE